MWMNSRQKEILQSQLNDEEAVLKKLKGVYKKALDDIDDRISALMGRTDTENLQSIIYQVQYQKALKTQINGILDTLNGEQFDSIADYISKSYESGFTGVMYDLHGQGIPLIIPIDQNQVVRAIQHDTKLSKSLYDSLGENISVLKKRIQNDISRGIAQGSSYADIAKNVASGMVGDYSKMRGGALGKAMQIARTESHRITNEATYDAQLKAKENGADVVKQWDATIDKRTRPHHAQLDGQLREIDEKFEVSGRKALYPGGFGIASEDVNCRCAVLQRAKWALDEDELQTLKDRAEYFKLDKTENFEDFKKKYLDASKNVIYNGNVINSTYDAAIKSGATVKTVGGIDCAVQVKDYGFPDGAGGIKKTAPATIYTLPDGTQFVYPKNYNKKIQSLSPEDAIATWQKIPDNLRSKIQKTVEVVDYYNPEDAYWRKTYKDFDHSYATGGDKITIYRSSYHDLDYLVTTYCHEGGHYIDYTLPGTSEVDRYCEQSLWQTAMKKDLATSGKNSWRAYGENSPLEDFADSVGYYVTHHDYFAKIFPERTKLLDIILK